MRTITEIKMKIQDEHLSSYEHLRSYEHLSSYKHLSSYEHHSSYEHNSSYKHLRGAIIKKNGKIWEKFPNRLDPLPQPPIGNFRLF